MNKQEWQVTANPAAGCPPEILSRQVGIEVSYHDFDGQDRSGIIEVHQSVTEDVIAFFALARQLRFPIEHILPASDSAYGWDDDKLMAGNVSSGFNYRSVAGSKQLSLHSQGRAFDINPRQNPYIRYPKGRIIIAPPDAVWEPSAPGTLFRGHPLVSFMLENKWEWGGDWTPESGRVDYQHFQKPL